MHAYVFQPNEILLNHYLAYYFDRLRIDNAEKRMILPFEANFYPAIDIKKAGQSQLSLLNILMLINRRHRRTS